MERYIRPTPGRDESLPANPRSRARLAASMYLLSGIPAGFYVYLASKLTVRGDPARTAANILGSESLFRFSLAGDLVGISLVLASVVVLYRLLKPASKDLALMMLCFCLMGSALQALNSLVDLSALAFLKGGPALSAWTPAQSQDLGYAFLRMHGLTYNLALVFFGFYSVMVGALVFRSGFLPAVFGLLLVMDGLGYLTAGLSMVMAPTLAARLSPMIPMGTALIGELPFMLWLIFKGVDEQRWHERAANQTV